MGRAEKVSRMLSFLAMLNVCSLSSPSVSLTIPIVTRVESGGVVNVQINIVTKVGQNNEYTLEPLHPSLHELMRHL